jgi:hypothetical protein
MCFMPGNATQPGPERDGGRKARCLLPYHQQNVLTHILSKDRVAEDPCQIVLEPRGISGVEGIKGLEILCRNQAQERSVVCMEVRGKRTRL